MDDHIQLIERARARAQHARAVRQQKAQQQRAVQSEKAKKRAKTVKAASLLAIAASPLNSLEGHASQVDLPENVLELVMSHIAHALEPGGVVGPSIVARNLANAALVSKQLLQHSAAPSVFSRRAGHVDYCFNLYYCCR